MTEDHHHPSSALRCSLPRPTVTVIKGAEVVKTAAVSYATPILRQVVLTEQKNNEQMHDSKTKRVSSPKCIILGDANTYILIALLD